MFSTKDGITKRAGLVFILSLLLEGPAFAQMTSGPGLSSGSGAGTGAGGSSGVLRTGPVRFRVWDQVRPARVCGAVLFRP